MLCFRLLAENSPAESLLNAVEATRLGEPTPNTYDVEPASFRLVPNAPFAYWVGERVRRLFQQLSPVEGNGRSVRVGDHPGDGFRFIRLWWEIPVPNTTDKWVPYQKGGSYSPFYADVHLVANWDQDRQSYKGFLGRPGRTSERPSNFEFFFRPGLTWPRRTTSGMSMRVLPSGSVFADKGPSLFFAGDNESELLGILAICQSSTFQALLALQLAAADTAARSYEVGIVQRTVLPKESDPTLSRLGLEAWTAKRSKDTSSLSTHAFLAPSLIRQHASLSDGIDEWFSKSPKTDEEIQNIQEEIDNIAYRIYSIDSEDRRALHQIRVGSDASEELSQQQESDDISIDTTSSGTGLRLVSELLNYVLGCALGRWDIRYATGERQPPELPAPFDPLPVCPPGMLQNPDDLPAAPADVPDDYPLPITWPGILISDPGHPEDIVARVRDAVAVIWGDHSFAIEQEACEILGVRTMREYFAEKRSGGKFFKDHLKCYSKSRRQAPIYWPLSTESGSYTLWIYYHRLSDDMLYTCINQFVEPKQKQLEGTRDKLAAKSKRSREEDKEYESAESLLAELTTFQAELERLAKIWKPNLNDGVQITAAPLWNLFRLPAWRNKLKKTWEEMEAGKYDWAHLSHSLWPERVIPKCAEDRSLAIAHGYEDDLWEEVKVTKGKKSKLEWQPKKNANKIVKKLVEKQHL